MEFWEALDELVRTTKIVIDRPKGSSHPRFPESIYPLNYGFLDGTDGGDGSGIDVWLGTLENRSVDGVIITVDPIKGDVELKVLVACTDEEIEKASCYHNTFAQKGLLVKRGG